MAVGGDEDHAHVLASLRPTHCPAEIVNKLKSSSSAWIHNTKGIAFFDWQDGYGAYSVGSSDAAEVKKYIHRQKEHHRTKTFQEEYLEMLKQSGIVFNEKFLW